MRAALGLLLFTGAVVGCRHAEPWAPSRAPVTALPLAERRLLPFDATAAPSAPPLGTPPPPPANYYNLTAEECRRMACKNSSVANLLESNVTRPDGPCADSGARATTAAVRNTVAKLLAEETRNRTAGAALALYYKLLELELKSDVLAATVVELDDLLKVNEKLLEKGFKQAADSHELKKQRIELLADQARLRSGIQKINGELKALLAIDSGTAGLLLPADQVRVVPEPLDPEAAVQLGLRVRSELNLLRTLANVADPRAVAAVRQALVALAPPLAAVISVTSHVLPALTPWVRAAAKGDAVTVRRQILALLVDREREVSKDIRSAVEEWTTARELVGIARSRFELAQSRVDEYEKRKKAGEGVEVDLRKARLDALKAEGELVGEIAKWKTADVKAREVMGLLCCE